MKDKLREQKIEQNAMVLRYILKNVSNLPQYSKINHLKLTQLFLKWHNVLLKYIWEVYVSIDQQWK